MVSRTPRALIAAFVSLFLVTVSASAAPEGRSESRDWLGRQITRLVLQIKKALLISPSDDGASEPIPPHP